MKGKILVADDEKEIRTTIKELLEAEGYQVKTANSVSSAKQILQEWNPNLILLDILFPGSGEGIEGFVKKVDPRRTKILYVSVYSKAAAKQLGFLDLSESIVGYIEKPFSTSHLLSVIEEALKEKK